ncbi:hypothetical protein GCM10023189_23600 [Nibrella saemangeumensis]|uniref:Secreted peptide n=1 Tax=Nibrella saemangeumensis TaxID=1084526 RepID=A0ABP8MT16_9BACT
MIHLTMIHTCTALVVGMVYRATVTVVPDMLLRLLFGWWFAGFAGQVCFCRLVVVIGVTFR